MSQDEDMKVLRTVILPFFFFSNFVGFLFFKAVWQRKGTVV